MIEAIIHKKIKQKKELIEDLITSSVFGNLKNIDNTILRNVLNLSKTSRNNSFSNITSDPKFKVLNDNAVVFWQTMKYDDCNRCEPDIIIENKYSIILIEAKYKSPKSSKENDQPIPNDQLAKEYDNLRIYGKKKGKSIFLIYLTAHSSYPYSDINDSKEEFERKRQSSIDIYWLSWSQIYSELIKYKKQNKMISDICKLLEYYELDSFIDFRINRWNLYEKYNWRLKDE